MNVGNSEGYVRGMDVLVWGGTLGWRLGGHMATAGLGTLEFGDHISVLDTASWTFAGSGCSTRFGTITQDEYLSDISSSHRAQYTPSQR